MPISDIQLQKNIIDELSYRPNINSNNIGVSVKNGIVTLTNTVSSWAEKVAVDDAIKKIGGVKGIANELEIDLPSTHKQNDTDIAEIAVRQLQWDIAVPDKEIKVEVEKGVLTLTGKVEWEYQKRAAEQAVQYIFGVKRIVNRIGVTPVSSSKEVKHDIEKALERMAQTEANKIQVETQGSKAILRGNVDSWFIREEIEKAAWMAPGIGYVENYISIS